MIVDLAYLAASLLFIFGLKEMSHSRTAARGNLLGASGMALAIVTAVADLGYQLSQQTPAAGINFTYILAGLLIGSIFGAVLAYTAKIASLPQMVALLNAFGGAAATLVAAAELCHQFGKSAAELHQNEDLLGVMIATAATAVVGTVTFWGSLFAYARLEGWDFAEKTGRYPNQQSITIGLAILTVTLGVLMVCLATYGHIGWAIAVLWLIVIVSSVLGVLLVTPIGAANMPVVISLLISCSGIASGLNGFVLGNNVLIISGALVGASGVILSQMMCKAMNRSLASVLLGSGAGHSSAPSADEINAKVRTTSPGDVAQLLNGAERVVFVPGYGMAVAQAQHAVRDLTNALEAQGAAVEFAIHPIAGRMPGHMNVLLAEAGIASDKLKNADAINPTLDAVDVGLVIGASDVVNPTAGMPVVDIGRCGTVIVIKRSLSPGFAGIPNPLYAADNTLMLFADGKDAVLGIVKAMKGS